MTIDPETERQIAELARDPRPLLVLDVDDVLLEFIRPFPRFLEKQGLQLKLDSFRLFGNVVEVESGNAVAQDRVSGLIDDFFVAQAEWQGLMEGAAETLEAFARKAEIVLLTAMPHRHRETRRVHLDALGLDFPLLTTELAKGPAIKLLRGETDRPVAFVDDQPRNLVSARDMVPDTCLVHLIAHEELRALLPPVPHGIRSVETWDEARPIIAEGLGL